MANRLKDSTSPYLLQHQDNPVGWWPWCPEAFAEARRRDVPVLLSVGYAACHWCHVMAHESFEDTATAELANQVTVAVKVDREERPDVDAVYMEALLALTGQGGWPMTLLLTPDGEPFFAATYLPRDQFAGVMTRVGELWPQRKEALRRQGQDLVADLANRTAAARSAAARNATTDLADTRAAADVLTSSVDRHWGGFGAAPKFPPAMAIEFLLRHAAGTGSDRAAEHLAAVEVTVERMARGGLYDQLAGGFARYSTDARWVVPHFEKMLYDNAQLARVYLHVWRLTGSALARRIALETAEWMLTDLLTPQGALAASLDADSDGREGACYVWTPTEITAALTGLTGDTEEVCGWLTVTGSGTFEHGRSVLQLPADPPQDSGWPQSRARLLEVRRRRPQPARDDKVVAAWNGLAIAALAEIGVLLDRSDLLAAAEQAATVLVEVHLRGDQLARTSRDGVPGPGAGVLEDYADVAEGLLALHQAGGDPQWLERAGELLEAVLDRFADTDGGFHDTAADAEPLVLRPAEVSDGATPSGASATAGALLTYAALTGSSRHRDAARAVLAGLAGHATRQPRFAGHALAVTEALLAGPVEVAVAGDAELARLARLTPLPGAVVVTGGVSPLLAGRAPGTVSVCREFSCRAPLSSAVAAAAELGVAAVHLRS